MVAQTENAPYAAAWDEYRRRWRVIYWLWAGVIAFGLLDFVWPRADTVLSVIALLLLISIFWAYSKVIYWPCPRCGQSFLYSRTEGSNTHWLLAGLSWRCRHCRLPKWAVRDPD